MKNTLSFLNFVSGVLRGQFAIAGLAVLCLIMAGTSTSADIVVMFENDELGTNSTSANADVVHANATASTLTAPLMNTNAGWPDALAVIQNDVAVNSLATAITSNDYFSFSVTPNSGFSASFSSMDVIYTLGANVRPAATGFSLLSSLTGFTDSSAIDTFSGSLPSASSGTGFDTFDISGATALQNVSGGTEIEFRIYAHNTGAFPMTRIGIGHAFATNGTSDLVLNGTFISSVPEPTSISLFGMGLVAILSRRRRLN